MEKLLQVSQVNKIVKDIVEHECVLENIRVLGEISSFSVTRGTAYFTLKDYDSMINCIMFNCKSNFNVGDSVVVEGSVKYYSKTGKLSLNCYSIEQYGIGELYKQFLLMKEKLQNEGLFDEAHKKPIPSFIKRVGVVTSKTGAVIQDIINVRTRRNPNLDIVVYDCQVQGVLAKQKIIEGINFFSEYENIDCIIVARGGGSLEDLQPFNEEEVARAVYNCKKPIISAVGHETDFTIIDFVADLRVPTPSAGAELVAFDKKEAKNTFQFYLNHITKSVENLILDEQMLVNKLNARIENVVNEKFSNIKFLCVNHLNRMESLIDRNINNTTYRLGMLLNTLDNLEPTKILQRGFSVIKKDENYQKDYSNLKINDIITVENNNSILTCKINDIKNK